MVDPSCDQQGTPIVAPWVRSWVSTLQSPDVGSITATCATLSTMAWKASKRPSGETRGRKELFGPGSSSPDQLGGALGGGGRKKTKAAAASIATAVTAQGSARRSSGTLTRSRSPGPVGK